MLKMLLQVTSFLYFLYNNKYNKILNIQRKINHVCKIFQFYIRYIQINSKIKKVNILSGKLGFKKKGRNIITIFLKLQNYI